MSTDDITIHVTPNLNPATGKQRYTLDVEEPIGGDKPDLIAAIVRILQTSRFESHHALIEQIENKTVANRLITTIHLNPSAAKLVIEQIPENTEDRVNDEEGYEQVPAQVLIGVLTSALGPTVGGGHKIIFHGEITAVDETSRCPDCDGEIDDEGDTLEEPSCPMDGMGWTHSSDCGTCGAVYCDSSC